METQITHCSYFYCCYPPSVTTLANTLSATSILHRSRHLNSRLHLWWAHPHQPQLRWLLRNCNADCSPQCPYGLSTTHGPPTANQPAHEPTLRYQHLRVLGHMVSSANVHDQTATMATGSTLQWEHHLLVTLGAWTAAVKNSKFQFPRSK